MNTRDDQDRKILQGIAYRAMLDRGLRPYFSAECLAELDKIDAPARNNGVIARDLRNLLWASIDNDDSRDLDQLSVAEAMSSDRTKILVAVADVDALVKQGSAIDEQARHNTTSVYTAGQMFAMLPEKLSTDLTSLNLNQDRLAIVSEMVVGSDGSIQDSDVYRGFVCNHAKLAYNRLAAWLEGHIEVPSEISIIRGLAENLHLQDKVARRMKNLRHMKGSLYLETIEAKPIFEGDFLLDLEVEEKNCAKDIIEEFMIAANCVTIRFLSAKNFPSIRRIVRNPKRWKRIVEIAAQHAFSLPKYPDSKVLKQFLMIEKKADPLRFPDLSLSVIKLLGSGEYIAEFPGENVTGHFGLAIKDYTHSTAPNRRYPDLITQRLLKAAIDGRTNPYSMGELDDLAAYCTKMEDAAVKVERQVSKSAAGLLLKSKIGEQFDALVTGASTKGTWVRLLRLPIEGMLRIGYEGIDVGDRIRVQLLSVDVEQGFIDFKKVGSSWHRPDEITKPA